MLDLNASTGTVFQMAVSLHLYWTERTHISPPGVSVMSHYQPFPYLPWPVIWWHHKCYIRGIDKPTSGYSPHDVLIERWGKLCKAWLVSSASIMSVKDICRLSNKNLLIKATLSGGQSIFQKKEPQSLLVAAHLNPPQNQCWIPDWFASRIQSSLRD